MLDILFKSEPIPEDEQDINDMIDRLEIEVITINQRIMEDCSNEHDGFHYDRKWRARAKSAIGFKNKQIQVLKRKIKSIRKANHESKVGSRKERHKERMQVRVECITKTLKKHLDFDYYILIMKEAEELENQLLTKD